ncbi:MAG: looped-hinge helix DNA binding domain, AbrB family [halophilic archaeon J07HB67]|jgi:looped-hinge helix DNA binding domain, AbrB family|nr:MAG: looped-hinge helix DNA binding domain, AbrB family [halophilic archaeon J07HB67]
MSGLDEQQTRIGTAGSVTIPRRIREELGVEEGDAIRWTVDEDGELSAELVHERYGAFDDFEPAEGDRDIDSVEDLDQLRSSE